MQEQRRREIERSLRQFEGLIAETARQIVEEDGAELEYEDVRQLLAIKCWRAIERYDAARDQKLCSLRRFVFGCLLNLRKDIIKRPRRFNHSIEEQRSRASKSTPGGTMEVGSRADWFDARYLSVDAEAVYFEVEDEPVVLPSTLSAIERRVVALRLEGRLLIEIDRETGLSRAQRERVMGSIRQKLADWAPAGTPRRAPRPPLPHALPARARSSATRSERLLSL